MSIAPNVTCLRTSAKRFARADQGNIATIFAIMILPILGFVGAAVDYSRYSGALAEMQSALDSTALMLSKDLASGTITAAEVSAKAQSYFTALYTNKGATNVSVTTTYTASSSLGSTIQVSGSATMTTDFLKVAGFPQLNLPVRPPPGAPPSFGWRWRSTTPDRWRTTARSARFRLLPRI